DQGRGRFWTMDTLEGDIQSPLSLHKYVYVSDNPVSFTDPTGKSVSNFFYGKIVHDKIGDDFVSEDPENRYYDRAINTILGASVPGGSIRPDLVDMTTEEVYEIKPTNSAPLGYVQLAGYLIILNKFDPQHRTWVPGATYFPPTPIQLDSLTFALVSPPAGGVIIYEVLNGLEILSLVALAIALSVPSLEFDFGVAALETI